MRQVVGKIVFVVGCVAIIALLFSYLNGMLFLISKGVPAASVTFDLAVRTTFLFHRDPGYRHAVVQAVAILSVATIFVVFVGKQGRRKLHGAARFASAQEIRSAGLTADNGIIVGRFGGRYLMFPGQQFVLLAAPTRSGKGVGVVIPNLLNFRDSLVVLDIKQENFDLTSGFRAAHGQEVFLFNPFAEDMRTHRYNPLAYIRDDKHLRIGDILGIGSIFFPPEGKDPSGKDAFWNEQALNLFLGLVLLVCETTELPRTIGEVVRQSSGYGKKLSVHLTDFIWRRFYEGFPLSKECVDALNRFLDSAEETRGSIQATFNAAFTMWSNPIVDAATSATDFLLTDVRKKRMTVYIGVTPNRLGECSRLINLFFSQLINLNVAELPSSNSALRYQCLLLMDEFTAIGKVNVIAKAVGYIAGYNLRLLTIVQSLSQLESVYGALDAKTLMTNHALQILYAPRDQKDAAEYSEMLGYLTEDGVSVSRPNGIVSMFGGGSSNNTVSEQRRALMLPQELKELGGDREIVIMENCKPILASKIAYYKEPEFKSRLLPPSDVTLLDLSQYYADVEAGRVFSSRPLVPPTQVIDDPMAGSPSLIESKAEEGLDPLIEPKAEEGLDPLIEPKAEEGLDPLIEPKAEESLDPLIEPKAQETRDPIIGPRTGESLYPPFEPGAEESLYPLIREEPDIFQSNGSVGEGV
ncbi:type IV secretory system conjugative DNA transfer family protein [Cupriavidus necator]